MFGSLIEQAMKAAQGGEGGQSAGGAPAVGPGGAAPGAQQPPRADGSLEQRVERLEQRADEDDRPSEQQAPPQREPLQRADERGLASGPEDGSSAAGPAPVATPESAAPRGRRRLRPQAVARGLIQSPPACALNGLITGTRCVRSTR